MANCTYEIKVGDNTFAFTKSLLITFLQMKNVHSIKDLKNLKLGGRHSLSRETIVQRVDLAIKLNLEIKSSDTVSEDYEYENVKTIINYLDEVGILNWEGLPKFNTRMFLDEAAFQEYTVAALINEKAMSPEEALKTAKSLIKFWHIMKEDSKEFHSLLADMIYMKDDGYIMFRDNVKLKHKSLYEKLSSTNPITGNEMLVELFDFVNSLNAKINTQLKGLRPDNFKGTSKYSLNFTANIKGYGNVGCHIDRMYIGENGKIYIFNYKMTTQNSTKWSRNKDLKYTYEAAFIKRILAANGIPVEYKTSDGKIVDNVEIYNIPIVLSYNEEADKIQSINFNNPLFLTYTVRDNRAYLRDFEKDVNPLIDVEENNIENLIIDEDLENANLLYRYMIPEYDAKVKGLQVSARNWIMEHYRSGDIKYNPDTEQWDIFFNNGLVEHIKNPKLPLHNQDMIDLISSRLDLISNGEPVVISSLVDEIINNYHTRTGFLNRRGFRFSAEYADATFAMYLNQNSDGEHDWQFIQNDKLLSCNILMFKNKQTGQIDIVIPSSFDPDEIIQTKNGRTNLLGHYLSDMNSPTLMKATYGNMEIMRALSIINEIMPTISSEGKLGSIKVITPYNGGKGLFRQCKDMVKEYNKIASYLKSNISDLHDYKIKFNRSGFVDSIQLITLLFDSIINSTEISVGKKNDLINQLGIQGLNNIKGKEAQIVKLQEIMESISEGRDPKSIIVKRNSVVAEDRIKAEIYIECLKTINRYNGVSNPEVESIGSLGRYMLPQYANPDLNVRYVGNLYSRCLDEIATKFSNKYGNIRKKIIEYYDNVGFGKTSSAVLGSAESLYKDMFERDLNGKLTWNFVNPYDKISSAKLTEQQRNFLKYILFQLGKLRAERIAGYSFNFSSENDPKLVQWLQDNNNKRYYLLVPLEKGSTAHQVKNGLSGFRNHYAEEFRKLKLLGFSEYVKLKNAERQSENNYSDQSANDASIWKMGVNNSLATSVDSMDARRRMLNLHENEYFETNLEYILADFIEKLIAVQEFNKVIFQSKCLLLEMHLLGDSEGELALRFLRKSEEEIEKYMKINIFGKSIMEDLSLQAMEFLTPAKRLMSHLFIAGNIRSAFRDSFEGLWQNVVRSLTHFQNDLTAKFIKQGYDHVLKDMFKSDRDINIMSELCLRYRLSNTDAAKIAERAKIGRGGIFNPDQWAYSTLRAPDFLNRMTLFVARCLQDGVWLAYSLDEETHQLKYNWKEDERFKAYASKDRSNPKYIDSKAAYYAAVLTYNQEHPNNPITFDGDETPLPEPYSQNEIRQFKMFADGIYGAYDKSLKGMYEHIFLGLTLGVFTTWLNGQAAAWFRKPGLYAEYFETKDKSGNRLIKKDQFSGNELYFTEEGLIVEKTDDGKYIDEYGNELDSNAEYVPVFDRVPILVQGIIYTLKESIQILFGEDGLQGFKRDIWNLKYNRANLNKALADLGMWILFALLFGLLFTPAYLEHKANKDHDDIITNLVTELLYKSTANSYDGFKGPFAIMQYVLDDMEPSAPNVSIKVLSDGIKVLIGEKNFSAYMYNNLPGIRVFKDTIGKAEKIAKESNQ